MESPISGRVVIGVTGADRQAARGPGSFLAGRACEARVDRGLLDETDCPGLLEPPGDSGQPGALGTKKYQIHAPNLELEGLRGAEIWNSRTSPVALMDQGRRTRNTSRNANDPL